MYLRLRLPATVIRRVPHRPQVTPSSSFGRRSGGERRLRVFAVGHEWYNSDIGEQTYDKYNWDGPPDARGRRTRGTFRTYRLAFAPYYG